MTLPRVSGGAARTVIGFVRPEGVTALAGGDSAPADDDIHLVFGPREGARSEVRVARSTEVLPPLIEYVSLEQSADVVHGVVEVRLGLSAAAAAVWDHHATVAIHAEADIVMRLIDHLQLLSMFR